MKLATLAALAFLALPLAGCLGFGEDPAGEQISTEQQKANELLGDRGRSKLEEAAAIRPRNYTIAGTEALPEVSIFFNDSVGPETNAAFESPSDDGGINYGSVVKTIDISAFIPKNQATEIKAKLWWEAAEGKAVDLDFYVDVPGTFTEHSPVSQDWNWNRPSKTIVVNTVGIPGANHLIGVEANNGRTTGAISFSMQITFSYERDAIGPGIPYALDVPANATGLIFESAKAGGNEHITSQFVVVGPNDELVSFQDYNDLAIPLEQVFVPTKGPGEYVVYAYTMRGGFLIVKADVPVDNREMRLLGLQTEEVVDVSAPSPGVVERDWLRPTLTNTTTPMTGGESKSFSLEAGFPLRVDVFVDSSGTAGFTGAVQAKLESPRGLVHQYQRIARVDSDQGTIGYTDDEAPNSVHNYANIDRGTWTITIVNDSNSNVGHRVLTYVR